MSLEGITNVNLKTLGTPELKPGLFASYKKPGAKHDKIGFSNPKKPSGVNRFLKAAGWGLLAAGVGANTAINYNDQQDKAAMVSKYNELSSRITLDRIAEVVKKITPSTVKVEGASGHGSGVIVIDDEGNKFILTNGHVVEDNAFENNETTKDPFFKIRVFNGSDFENAVEFNAAPVILSDGKRAYFAVGDRDMALLRIPPNVELKSGAGIKIRDISKIPLVVGEPVIAVGNPFSENDTVTFGIISHVDRKSGLNTIKNIQTNAGINPGNSGGGLFDIDGNLVGINTWGYRGADGIAGSIRADEILKAFLEWGIRVGNK